MAIDIMYRKDGLKFVLDVFSILHIDRGRLPESKGCRPRHLPLVNRYRKNRLVKVHTMSTTEEWHEYSG